MNSEFPFLHLNRITVLWKAAHEIFEDRISSSSDRGVLREFIIVLHTSAIDKI